MAVRRVAAGSPFDDQVAARVEQLLEAVVVPADAARPGAAMRQLEDDGAALGKVDLALVTVPNGNRVTAVEHRTGVRRVHGGPHGRRDHVYTGSAIDGLPVTWSSQASRALQTRASRMTRSTARPGSTPSNTKITSPSAT